MRHHFSGQRGQRDPHSTHDSPHHWFALWHAIGHHHGGRGGGRGHRHGHHGFGDHGDSMPRARRMNSDDLQLVVLALLAQEARHGYELIKALEALSNGFYTPSPGMIYPALTYLEELGHVSVEALGNRKRYALSDSGRDYLAEHRERADIVLERLSEIGSKMDSVRRAFAGESEDDDDGGWVPEFREIRRALKASLRRWEGSAPDDQRRVLAILARALEEIEAIARDRK